MFGLYFVTTSVSSLKYKDDECTYMSHHELYGAEGSAVIVSSKHEVKFVSSL